MSSSVLAIGQRNIIRVRKQLAILKLVDGNTNPNILMVGLPIKILVWTLGPDISRGPKSEISVNLPNPNILHLGPFFFFEEEGGPNFCDSGTLAD